MLFKSLGIASATNNASNSEDAKPVTIRLTDGEVQLYMMQLLRLWVWSDSSGFSCSLDSF